MNWQKQWSCLWISQDTEEQENLRWRGKWDVETAYKNKVASAIELLDGEIQHEKITQELVDATIDTVYVYDKNG